MPLNSFVSGTYWPVVNQMKTYVYAFIIMTNLIAAIALFSLSTEKSVKNHPLVHESDDSCELTAP